MVFDQDLIYMELSKEVLRKRGLNEDWSLAIIIMKYVSSVHLLTEK